MYLGGKEGGSSCPTALEVEFRLFSLLASIKGARLVFAPGWNWKRTPVLCFV